MEQAKSREDQPKSSEEQPKSREHRPKSSEDQRKSSEGHQKSREEQQKSSEEQQKSSEDQRKSREDPPPPTLLVFCASRKPSFSLPSNHSIKKSVQPSGRFLIVLVESFKAIEMFAPIGVVEIGDGYAC